MTESTKGRTAAVTVPFGVALMTGFIAIGILLTGGCDFNRLTAKQTVKLFKHAGPALERHWDYDFAGRAVPPAIMQFEGILRVIPDNEDLLLQLIRAYAAYGYGWIEDEFEQADFAGDLAQADRLRMRARTMYRRARDLALYWLELRQPGTDEARQVSAERFQDHLESVFVSVDDAPALLWAGYTWGAAINLARDDQRWIADLPFARALVERSVALDDTCQDGAGLAFLGFATASFPPALGGEPEKGKPFFQRAMKLTENKNLLYFVQYAMSYAVSTQDKALFLELLRKVQSHPDVPQYRLTNEFAKRRAVRYLARVDDYFL